MPAADDVHERRTRPVIYAELLPNIRSVSVTVHLYTPRTFATSLTLADNGTILVLQHEDVIIELALPVKVVCTTGKPLPISDTSCYDMTLRLQPDASALNELLDMQSDDLVPWSASMLQHCLDIHCLNCTLLIVVASTIKAWQDLPSANWAEMMDFWHCHKPVDHKHEQHDEGEKGYGAGNILTARSGTGFVDVTTLLLSPEDCTNIKVSLHMLFP